MSWSPGDTIVVQEEWRGKLWAARPMTVVEDRPDRLALWFPAGTAWMLPLTPPSRPKAPTRAERIADCMALVDWKLGARDGDVATLWLMPEGARHAVGVSWRDGWDPFGWYVNLQAPLRRTSRGVLTFDLALDVVVDTERRWAWKDEDELALLAERSILSHDEAAALRAEGERVIACLEANEAPFCEPWHEWRPDPAWHAPVLPAGWDRLDG